MPLASIISYWLNDWENAPAIQGGDILFIDDALHVHTFDCFELTAAMVAPPAEAYWTLLDGS